VAEDAFPAIERAVGRGLTAWCAEAVGAMDALLEAAIDYTRTRVQFGRPLAANQAVRHRLADMAVALEEARSLALKATLSDDAATPDRARIVAAARVKVGRSARYVAEQAVQLHGGMGVTEELRIGAYLRRLLALNALFGSPEEHLRRHVRLRGRAA
jgi:alkylation response protein AidB-like acyl-CoA dehydrogenase